MRVTKAPRRRRAAPGVITEQILSSPSLSRTVSVRALISCFCL
jgi:hypothetical protein